MKSLLSLPTGKPKQRRKFALVIHGGAGTITRDGATPEQLETYRVGLRAALYAGYSVLQNGGEAMDAAVAAVTVLEDNELFNAGKGAVFNTEGKNELEASIMLSKPPSSHPEIPATRRGLGLTLLTHVRNPSQTARALYLAPSIAPHTFLSGETAEHLAESLGQTLVDPSYFFTERRWKEHRRGLGLPDEPFPPKIEQDIPSLDVLPKGTVGAVALDERSCICAVTSTGGRTNKLPGRIGDTPIVGAGFWAQQWDRRGGLRKVWRKLTGRPNFKAVGISGTGDGDYFIRQGTASSIAHHMRLRHEPVEKAARVEVEALDGLGGVIALDSEGQVALPMNCPGMYRGLIREDGIAKTAIFDDDVLT